MCSLGRFVEVEFGEVFRGDEEEGDCSEDGSSYLRANDTEGVENARPVVNQDER